MKLEFKENSNIDLFDFLSNKNLTTYTFLDFNSKPSSIFYLSYDKLEKEIIKFDKEIENLRLDSTCDFEIDQKTKLYDSLKTLILALDSFYDNCLLIIRSLTPQDTYKFSNLHTQEWLSKNKIPDFLNFKSKANSTHDLIRQMSNILKHSVYIIENIYIQNHKKANVHGFNLSTIDDEGHPKPYLKIHPLYKNKISTAISYNYFIKYIIFCTISYIKILEDIFITKKNSIKRTNLMNFNQLKNIIKKYSTHYFPDEYKNKPIVHVTINEKSLTIEYTKKYKISSNENIDKIYCVKKICLKTMPSQSQFSHVIPYLPLCYPEKNNYFKDF